MEFENYRQTGKQIDSQTRFHSYICILKVSFKNTKKPTILFEVKNILMLL